jgi:hypothetical protein
VQDRIFLGEASPKLLFTEQPGGMELSQLASSESLRLFSTSMQVSNHKDA